MQSGMTALLLACSMGHEEAVKVLVAPTQAAGAIDVLVRAWLYVSLSLSWPIDVLVYIPSWDFEGVIMTVPCDRVVCWREREGNVRLGL